MFSEFCSDLGTDQGVWDRIQCVARETQATRDVLDANSTVRMVAIENIGETNILFLYYSYFFLLKII